MTIPEKYVQGLRKTYLLDWFSLDSIATFPFFMTVNKISAEYFCELVTTDITLENGLTRKNSADLIYHLCGVSFRVKKPKKVKFATGDVALVISFDNRKTKVTNKEQAINLIERDKVRFYEVIV